MSKLPHTLKLKDMTWNKYRQTADQTDSGQYLNIVPRKNMVVISLKLST